MNTLKKFRHLFDPIDLTKGSILKDMVIFLIPILLSMVFQQIYTTTDAIVVGQNLGPNEIAGINDVGPLSGFALQFAIGCTSGFSVIIANKIGEANLEDARKSFLTQIILSLIISVVLTVAFCLLTDPLLSLMKIVPSSTDSNKEAIYQAAHDYLFIIYLGIICQMAYNQIFSVLRALGDSYTPFLFLVLGTVLNIFLDILFIVPLKWGVAGSAWATILSELLAAAGCYIYAFLKYPFLRFRKGDGKVSWPFIYKHLRLGLPLGFQFSILEIGIIIMQMAVIAYDFDPNGLAVVGAPAQVGYSVSNRVNYIIMNVYIALGDAMLTYMGQNDGAKEYGRIKEGLKISLLIGTVSWVILTTVGLLLTIHGAYLYIFLKPDNITPEVMAYGNEYLYISVPCDFFLMILFICRNCLQGLNKPLFPFLAGVGELVARSLICLYLPVQVNGGPINSEASALSYYVTCSADALAWIVAAAIMIVPLIIVIRNRMKKNPETVPNRA